ncbi:MAG: methionine--tRNA ligase [Spirochaetes bacterium GWD1_27_9]|nr:MAG: methionine--tRNA ligase [Spirochaetes bacterium GWB1_27_13]OHD24954.1 MAG: methionine--tRNA ligase [Spirochaetes bacterium GWC1_27_15]OHD38542.1 MAG: methionine--tRNA ligase [Spirochaetes bacterium GWD1_27_9]
MAKKRLITSALPYVNNIPHLGNIIGCVLSADVFARYSKIAGYETLFVCGTDEYGTTTETKALQEGLTPQELCDKYHSIHKEIYQWFNIGFSYFGRTSTPDQTKIVQDIFLKLYKNGYIVEDILTQPYCEHDKMFLADRFVEGTCPHCGFDMAKGDQCDKCGKLLDPTELKNSKCAICKKSPIFKQTKHLFLDLEVLKDKLENWINEAAKEGNWSNNALSTTKGWIEQGLKKRCITRDLKWGVPVPLEGFEGKVFYVWFDAPIGYISITANKFSDWENWWKNPTDVELYQFMGKDNIPFHTVLFPASLIGSGDNWTLLKTISSTEYLNYEELKFSKSRGTGVFGDQAKDTGIDPDLFRYYLLRNRPEKNDTQFFWNDFMDKANGEIIANYANLVNRILQFIDKFFDGIVPEFEKEDTIFASMDFLSEKDKIIALFENLELKNALLSTLDLCSLGNKFFQDSEPWTLVKSDKIKTGRILGSLCGFIKDISILLYPYIPQTAEKVFGMLNIPKELLTIQNIGDYSNIKGKKTNKPVILFNKLEKELIDNLKEKFSGKKEETTMSKDLFGKIYLKVGQIVKIERHPKADKLYVEQIDLGNGETRQIVSGLVPFYKEEELLNKKIVLVYNLKAANLRGTKSEGMLLAAENTDRTIVEVLSPEGEIGDVVTIDGVTPQKDEITIDDFFAHQIDVANYTVNFAGNPLKVGDKEIKVTKVENGKVG